MSGRLQVALFFALPQEYGAFMRLTGGWVLNSRTPFKSFTRTLPDREILLVEAGMGGLRMLEALQWVLGWVHPDFFIAAGFAGSLAMDLKVGEICLGEVFSVHGMEFEPGEAATVTVDLPKELTCFCRLHRVRIAQMVTVEKPKSKRKLSRELPGGPWIMDMEGYFVALFCFRNRLPFISIRAVSDGFRDEIDFDPGTISDDRGHVSIPLVLASILRNPCLLKSYLHSWKHSLAASRSLGKVLAALLKLPSHELNSLTEMIRSRL